MKKIMKNKRGFTLVEMVLVIAIIVILASVLFISVAGYLEKANTAKAKADSHNSALAVATSAIAAAGG